MGEVRKRTACANSSGSQNRPDRDLREELAALRLVHLLGHRRRLHVARGDRVHVTPLAASSRASEK
jgi:hypothetical protein